MPLTELEVKNAKPAAKAYKLYDGGGLFLLVHPNGGKYWRFRYRNAEGEQLLSFGPYPRISLSRARKKRTETHDRIDAGSDPATEKRRAKAADDGADRFSAVADDWVQRARTNSAGRQGVAWSERHEARVRKFLDAFLIPDLGGKRASEITAPDVLATLRKLEARGASDTAQKVKSIAHHVMGHAVAIGHATRNPLADLPRNVLTSKPVKHHAAITDPAKVGQLLRDIRACSAYRVTKWALELLPLLFVRPGELRNAEWSEFDLDNALWSIPAGRMKMRQPHLVPLSKQAVRILQQIHAVTEKNRLVFPGVRHHDKPMSENTLNAALRSLGYDSDTMTAHGFRAMARTLLDEQLGCRVEHIEHQLGHAVKDANGRAYNRTSFLPERRKMMQRWSDYLDQLASGAKVIRMKSAGR